MPLPWPLFCVGVWRCSDTPPSCHKLTESLERVYEISVSVSVCVFGCVRESVWSLITKTHPIDLQ